MVQIVGKYEHVSNSPEFEPYLKAMGSTPEITEPVLKSKPTIAISQAADQWTLKVSNAGKDATTTFKLGEAYDEAMPHGLVVKSITKREGDKFVTTSSLPDGRSGTRVYEFSDAGITVYLDDEKSGIKATRVYKRV